MMYNLATYLTYFLLLLFVVLYVGAMLFRNGRPFLVNTFSGNTLLADSVNRFLLAGYYLVNIGYTIIFLKITKQVYSFQEMFEILGTKAGGIILTLGIMHFMNVIVLITIGRNRKPKSI